MVYITGDTHREFERVEEFCEEYGTTDDDVLIILGDVGINYYLDDKDSSMEMLEFAEKHFPNTAITQNKIPKDYTEP